MSDLAFGNRLLVIDDEPAICRLVQRVAQGEGFEVIVTNDPEKFTKTARLWQPTVIVLDLRMPGIDGIQLLRALAGDRCSAHVVVSSGSDARIIDAAMRLGQERGLKMSGALPKPIGIQALREMLSGLSKVPKSVLAADLAKAIAADQLSVDYQPKFTCTLGGFAGVEALARWHHPTFGTIRPDEFITLAEEGDLIHSLTDWVIRTAARQAAAWRRDGYKLVVAVNISARDIEDIDLPERLHQAFEASGIGPDGVVLELTETGVMRQAVQMMDVLTRLRLKGFHLSMDDFGTGYSSLVQLQRMPFSEIKIDRSFVRQMATDVSCRLIVEIIILLAQKLGLRTVAEGVEDEASLKTLAQLGCYAAQGYHLARPMPADGISSIIRRATVKGRRCTKSGLQPTNEGEALWGRQSPAAKASQPG